MFCKVLRKETARTNCSPNGWTSCSTILCNVCNQRCNVASNRWAGNGVGGYATLNVTELNLRRIQVRKREQIGLNQPLKYIHHFRPFSPQFLFDSFQLSSQKKNIFLGRKNIGGKGGIPPLPRPNPKLRLRLRQHIH